MTTNRRVALVAIADDNRTAIATYLTSAGFDVHPCEELPLPSSFGALVLLGDEAAGIDTIAYVRSWMKMTKGQRVVIVTSKPTGLRDLIAAHAGRLFVLPAPVFGWELVDALRMGEPPRPGSA